MIERCVGCGAEFEKIEGPTHRYMTSAPGCWERYGELLGVMAIDPALIPARIMAVDAYAAQHPGTPNPQAIQSVGVHLLNFYDYLVRGRPAQPPRFAGHKGAFVWLEPPSFEKSLTVRDMPIAGSREEINAAARAWAESVWNAWSARHAQIAAWYAKYSVS